MYSIKDIQQLHVEISSRCNAACPQCPRNLYGYPFNNGYTEHDMTLAEAKIIFKPEFIQQLKELLINGDFGDLVMNPETIDIISYFREHNPDLHIMCSTNGGARDAKFWQDLARLNTEVFFCLDGLEDTHSIYRRNTLYSTVLKNAQTYIAAGGRAIWKFIKFPHNEHQFEEAQRLSQELGFSHFHLERNRNNYTPVFTRDGEFIHFIGNPESPHSKYRRVNTLPDLNRIIKNQEKQIYHLIEPAPKTVVCEVKQSKSLYVSSIGEVYPCCYMGHFPKTYNRVELRQVSPLIKNNNALEHSLETCIEWFNAVEDSWAKPSCQEGKLKVCVDTCGQS